MRKLSLAALGIAAYAVFLLATIPASIVASRAANASGGAVQLTDPRGTLWNGQARATVLAPGGVVVIDRVKWRFAPSALAAGHVAFDIVAAGRGVDATFTLGRGLSRWIVAAADARIDAAVIAALAPLLGASHPEGTVTIATSGLRVKDDGQARGKLTATWTGAALSLSEVRPLGQYSLEATAEDGPAAFSVTTKEGALRISGHGTYTAPAAISFTGEARGEGDQARALEPLLDLLGAKRPDGAREIRIQR